MFPDHEKFHSLTADSRALILARMGQAHAEAAHYAESGRKPAEAFTRLQATLQQQGMPALAARLWDEALAFPPADPYRQQQVKGNYSKMVSGPVKPGARMSRLERALSRAESEFLLLHRQSPMDNATPGTEKFELFDTLGGYTWRHVRAHDLSQPKLTRIVEDAAAYLRLLPLHERYNLKMYATRTQQQLRPATALINFRSLTDTPFMHRLLSGLLVDSVEEGVAVREDTSAIVTQLLDYTNNGLPTPLQSARVSRAR